MTRWVLDNGPLVLLGRFARPAWSWPPNTIEVVREVAEEAKKTPHGRRLLELETDGQSWVQVHDMSSAGPATEMLFGHLRCGAASTKNLGEDASIAFCAIEAKDAVFVSLDNNATYTALAELGPGRVATPFDLWAALEGLGLIEAGVRDDLNNAVLRKRQNLPGVPKRF